jgi:hypothetical protein
LATGCERQQLGTNLLFGRRLRIRRFDLGIAGDDDLCREIEFRVTPRIIVALGQNQGRAAERIMKQAARA